ncbi:hypothetical protein NDU88_007611 [Pleurodeles waltl]|uniref:Uncharacterized protein n=1 Tax=Pleurodeles waltl TaxID=8319 RepID=A0AAV7VT33_PLEWA|nr:hypothetical protein NDU88_007611 [Pleurodeles waltl]
MVRGTEEHHSSCTPLGGTSSASVAPTAAVRDAAISVKDVPSRVGLPAVASLEEVGGAGLAELTCCCRTRPEAAAALGRTSAAGLECTPGLRAPTRL